jgi:sigma-B regulation protein RsbU (phosphoserine phosphatase)
MTLFSLRLEDRGERLTWVRAGHEPALIYNASADSFEELHGQGIAMGIRAVNSTPNTTAGIFGR